MRSFSGSLASFRYASTLTVEEVAKLGLSQDDAGCFIEMVQDAAHKKEALPTFPWKTLLPVEIESLTQYDKLPPVADEDKVDILNKFAVLKLNGGVGSTMGLKRPKALLYIKGNENFLTAVVDSVASLNETFKGLEVPLVMMNSFATHDATVQALRGMDVPASVKILHFVQRKFPRLSPTTLRPLPTSAQSASETWYPPGHGDIFEMLVRSGVAKDLIDRGKTYVFVSNIDNPGAELDPLIAQHVIRSGLKVLAEFTPRTPNDRSGGVLVRQAGQESVLELSQVPDTHLAQFGSLAYSSFNTNNMWLHLPSLIELVNSHQLRLQTSTVLRELENGTEVLQLEKTMASVISLLPPGQAQCIAVPRKRWRVIKTTADLLMVRADGLLRLHKGRLILGEQRRIPGLPTIKWGSHFRNVKDVEARIPFPPDILELVHLSVEGDVRFGRNVKLAGTVILIATSGNKLVIPDNAILRDNIVIGELTITPH